MARILVLGYGNPLRSDDGLGWQVAVQLFRANQSADVEVLPCHQLTPELAETISRATVVLFIDCTKKGVPGEFHCEEIHWQTGSMPFTHDLSPTTLLDLASQLFGACPRAFLLTICGECFATGEVLSPAVNRQITKLKECVRELITECQQHALAR
jgi:hydrogenase maturation protease